MLKSLCVLGLMCLSSISFAQISGVVTDLNSGEAIIGAKVLPQTETKQSLILMVNLRLNLLLFQ